MTIATTNPATGEVEAEYEPHTDAEVELRLAAAVDAFAELRRWPFSRRAEAMRRAADLLDADVDVLATTMTREMGKTFTSAQAEVRKCATCCRYYADHAEGLLRIETADAEAAGASAAYVRYEPLGPVLAVMPWNFPMWQVIRFAAPALMAGNVGVLKHASNVPQTAEYLDTLFARAGFPVGAFSALRIGADRVETVLRDPRVRAATLTGSEPAGRSIAAIAGDEVKPTVLELGGSDPFIVMPSADLDRAVRTAITARVQNNGQSCIAAKRFLVHEAIADEFERRFVEGMRALVVGDPMDPATDVGPLVDRAGLEATIEIVEDARDKGATIHCGGQRLDRPGWFYAPTVVSNITSAMRIFREELFAPVAALYRISDEQHAVQLANATSFGLGASVWTEDADERAIFIDALESGQVFVNDMTVSSPYLPFGGVKRSGYGRELSVHGIRAFCNAKAVWVH